MLILSKFVVWVMKTDGSGARRGDRSYRTWSGSDRITNSTCVACTLAIARDSMHH